jgi:hypothetical protein
MPTVFSNQAKVVAETTPYVHGALSVHGGDGTAGVGGAGMGGGLVARLALYCTVPVMGTCWR